MSENQSPAAFITGLFETHLQVVNLELSMEFYERILGLELIMKEQARRVAFYWVGGFGKTVLVSGRNRPGSLREMPETRLSRSISLSRSTSPIWAVRWLPSSREGSSYATFLGRSPTYPAFSGGCQGLRPTSTTRTDTFWSSWPSFQAKGDLRLG